MLAMLLLGFASGLPLALTAGALQSWLTIEGLSIKSIGYFSLVALPYTFKFVWAPLMDRFEPSLIGRRRSWIVIAQLGLGLSCFAMAGLSPKSEIGLLATACVAMAFFSASQDVVFDAYRSDLLSPEERGAGAAITVLGYRLAMLVSGGLALIIADQYLGWPNTYRALGLVFFTFMLITWLMPKVSDAPAPTSSAAVEIRGFLAMLFIGVLIAVSVLGWKVIGWPGLVPADWAANKWASLAIDTLTIMSALSAAIFAARKIGFPSFVKPWDAFMEQKGALWFLALIVLYKLGDAFAGSLSTSFLIKGVGFTQTEVGAVTKVSGLIATLVGAVLGGLLMTRWSLFKSLLAFGILQAVSNLAYWFLSIQGKDIALMTGAIWLENLCGGMGTAAFVAFLMTLTDKRFSAAQFALLSALSAVGRVYVGPTAGVLVESVGWSTFFLITVLFALPGILLLIFLRKEVRIVSEKTKSGAVTATHD